MYVVPPAVLESRMTDWLMLLISRGVALAILFFYSLETKFSEIHSEVLNQILKEKGRRKFVEKWFLLVCVCVCVCVCISVSEWERDREKQIDRQMNVEEKWE